MLRIEGGRKVIRKMSKSLCWLLSSLGDASAADVVIQTELFISFVVGDDGALYMFGRSCAALLTFMIKSRRDRTTSCHQAAGARITSFDMNLLDKESKSLQSNFVLHRLRKYWSIITR